MYIWQLIILSRFYWRHLNYSRLKCVRIFFYIDTEAPTVRLIEHTTTPSRLCVCVCVCVVYVLWLMFFFEFVCMLKLIVQRLIDDRRCYSLLLRMPRCRCVHISQIPTTDERERKKKHEHIVCVPFSSSSSFINVGILTVCSILPCVKYFTGAVCTFFRIFSTFFRSFLQQTISLTAHK